VVGDLTTPLPPFDKGDSTPKKIFKLSNVTFVAFPTISNSSPRMSRVAEFRFAPSPSRQGRGIKERCLS